MYTKSGEVLDYREMLRVKVKSLAAEAKIIRREEGRVNGVLQAGLHAHRVISVRSAARASHLAYGIIRGRSVTEMERVVREPRSEALWKEVKRMVDRYGPIASRDRTEMLTRCNG